eukprot:505485-Pelagomonas_calceolata.AAC.1
MAERARGKSTPEPICHISTFLLDRRHQTSGQTVYAQRKHSVINTVKPEVVHFNSSGSDLP